MSEQSAFLARFKGKISSQDASGIAPRNNRPNPRVGQAKRNSRGRGAGAGADGDYLYQQYDNDRYDAHSNNYNEPNQMPAPPMNQQRKPKASLKDLDSMMMRQSMKGFSEDSRGAPPPQDRQFKGFNHRQKQYNQQDSPDSRDGPGYMPSPGEPVRDRAQFQQPKARQKPPRSSTNHYMHEDDPINQYYKNRPKQAPSKSRDTYLDARLRDLTKPDESKVKNEKHIRSDDDQLYFSRKARPVNYKPRNLKQWKDNKEDYVELGKLKPDLNTDELVAKRANRDRVKDFSQNLNNINQRICQPRTDRPPKPVSKPKSTRDKAQEYAKRVPKPRVVRKPEPAIEVDEDLLVDGEVGAEAKLTALEELEMRHNAARKDVDAIRKDMAKRGLK
jgi:hypothetical protein